MASGFYALFDDIATLLDDVASMSKDVASISKVAGKKTSGILGDDLAVNAEKASGFNSSRELPILWAIAKGSFLNKIIILPVIFLLSAYLPWSITPILLIGGTYLAYEGVEKIIDFLFHQKKKKLGLKTEEKTASQILEYEKKKIKSAILVDFILSIEIIIITLSSVIDYEFTTQLIVVSLIAILATIGVYSIVAIIVRLDDFGFKLIKLNQHKKKSLLKSIGYVLVYSLPYIIKSLNIIGTIAMILVAGNIYLHQIHFIHELLHDIPSILSEILTGLIFGLIAFLLTKVIILILKPLLNRNHDQH
jgi:predicted DNA repair protein MutK